MTTEIGNIEKWNIHLKAKDVSQFIIDMWPIIKEVHKTYPNDIFTIMFSRIHHLYEKDHGFECEPDKRKLDMQKINNQHPFWTETNPFPINCTAEDDQILTLWQKKTQESKDFVLTQLEWEIQAMIKMKNKN